MFFFTLPFAPDLGHPWLVNPPNPVPTWSMLCHGEAEFGRPFSPLVLIELEIEGREKRGVMGNNNLTQ